MKCNCDQDYQCDEEECIAYREMYAHQMYLEYKRYVIKLEDGSLVDVRDLKKQ